jgi:hypothetical protein
MLLGVLNLLNQALKAIQWLLNRSKAGESTNLTWLSSGLLLLTTLALASTSLACRAPKKPRPGSPMKSLVMRLPGP